MFNQQSYSSIRAWIISVAVIVLGVACMYWGSSVFAKEAPAAKVPESLTDTGEFGENIYDAAKDKDWAAAGKKLASLKESAGKLKTDLADGNAEQKKGIERLSAEIAALDAAVAAKQQQAVLEKSNLVTLIVAELTEPYAPKTPAAVTKLDYYGRELEIWAAAGDLTKLQASAEAISSTWAKVKPAIEAKGGTTEAKDFSKLVAQLEKAKLAGEYGAVAKPILDQVDKLEQVFLK